MLVGYMRVSSDGDRQVLDLQRDALLSAGVDERHLFEDHASCSRGDGSVAMMSYEEAGAFSPSTGFPYAALSKMPAMKIACARISRPMFRT